MDVLSVQANSFGNFVSLVRKLGCLKTVLYVEIPSAQFHVVALTSDGQQAVTTTGGGEAALLAAFPDAVEFTSGLTLNGVTLLPSYPVE